VSLECSRQKISKLVFAEKREERKVEFESKGKLCYSFFIEMLELPKRKSDKI
jgi:hypothetical protein